MIIRLTLGPGDSYDFEIKPFDRLTTAEHIRIYETPTDGEGLDPWPDVAKAKATLKRYSGAPDRYIRYLSAKEVDQIIERINEANAENDRMSGAVQKVRETLDAWAKEHDGQEWGYEDAAAVLDAHGLYRQEVTVNGRTYRTVNIEEEATFGQWIDLQAAMDTEGQAEGMSFVSALSIMMAGEDGAYPSQRNDEPDAAYEARTIAYTSQRREDFLAAPFVDVLGVAAFFFSKSERFAAICAHNMSSLLALLPRSVEPVRRVIPRGGGLTPN